MPLGVGRVRARWARARHVTLALPPLCGSLPLPQGEGFWDSCFAIPVENRLQPC